MIRKKRGSSISQVMSDGMRFDLANVIEAQQKLLGKGNKGLPPKEVRFAKKMLLDGKSWQDVSQALTLSREKAKPSEVVLSREEAKPLEVILSREEAKPLEVILSREEAKPLGEEDDDVVVVKEETVSLMDILEDSFRRKRVNTDIPQKDVDKVKHFANRFAEDVYALLQSSP
jgi:hypothetical protein